MDVDNLKLLLEKHEQGHLLHHWDSLTPEQRHKLYDELSAIDYAAVTEFFSDAMASCDHGKVDDIIEPLPDCVCGDPSQCSPTTLQSYCETGYKAISSGEVAVVLLAGGQGTRLGVPYPKGMYDVGLPSGKTLYQLQAERILRIQSLAEEETGQAGVIPWYIMTSEHTKQPTQKFFEKHNHFGLDPQNIVIFEQNLLPAFSLDGKIILSKLDKVALSPDGNGGLYRALKDEKVVEDMERRGVRYTYVYCVDNILVRVADPQFVGFCVQRNADCAAVVVEKLYPTERVGVVCKVGGVYQVVEYSEISLKTAERRNLDGSLTFCHANICNHFLSVDFLQQCIKKHEGSLPHHVAKKSVAYVAENGEIVAPTSPNAIKMEKFVFDVFRFASNFAVWKLQRETGFSPLKNSDGSPKDNPTSCRESLSRLHTKFVTDAGAKLVSKDGTPLSFVLSSDHTNNCSSNGNEETKQQAADFVCEISPLVSYSGEALADLCTGKTFISPLSFERDTRGSVQITQGTV